MIHKRDEQTDGRRYREEGPGRAAAPPSPLLAVPNVTAHPSTASVPVTVLVYSGPLLCRCRGSRIQIGTEVLTS